jgi:hypothetical protein
MKTPSHVTQIVVDKHHAKRDRKHMGKAEFDRDMRRLKDLREKYAREGLNTYESNEVDRLAEKWDIDRLEFERKSMFKN